MPWRSQIRMIEWVRGAVVRIGHQLHIDSMPTVLVEVDVPAVADPAALDESAVGQDAVGIDLAQHLEQARCLVGKEADHRGGAGVDGAHRDAKARRDLLGGVALAQVHQC